MGVVIDVRPPHLAYVSHIRTYACTHMPTLESYMFPGLSISRMDNQTVCDLHRK